jgi:penicillin-binding protein 1C
MWEISGVYASLARQLNHFGKYSSRYDMADFAQAKILKDDGLHKTQTGKIHPSVPTNMLQKSYLSAGAVYNTFEAMQELVRPGEEQLWNQFVSSKKIAWKTGTSFGFRDGWAIGITPKNVVCVWVGNADGEGRPGLTGIQTAAPVMFEIMKLLPYSPWFAKPYDDLHAVAVCRQSGNIPNAHCQETDTLWVAQSIAPAPQCNYHQLIHVDANKQFRVSSDCELPSNMNHISWFVLPPAMEWYYRNHDPNYRNLPPWRADCNGQNMQAAMEMIYPKRNTQIFVPKVLDGSSSKCVFEVAHRNPNTKIFWHLNNQYIGTTRSFHQMGLNPSAGKHLLILIDEKGERIELPFEVLIK